MSLGLIVVEIRHVSTFVFVFTDAHSMLSLTVRQLEPGHLKEDYPITTLFENKRFSRFFLNGTNKIQGSTMQ